MEVYLQYQRVRKSVQQHLAKLKDDCSCPSYSVNANHGPDCKLSDYHSSLKNLPAGSTTPDAAILVGWEGENDPLNSANLCTSRKLFMTFLVSLIAVAVTAASAIDACGVREYRAYFQVSEVVGSLATGQFLIGLHSVPFSPALSLKHAGVMPFIPQQCSFFLIFVMPPGLAPNLHSHLIFRFFAGLFASTPLICAGGTVADLWNPLEKTYAFPVYAIPAFDGPIIGQFWELYFSHTRLALARPETYGNLILYWKASILRKETGHERYRAPIEINQKSLSQRLKTSVYRPLAMFYSELIIILMSLYLTIIYIVLYTFLEGYTCIFGDAYGLSEGLTNLCWASMLIGTLLVSGVVPVVYSLTAKAYARDKSTIAPEMRLWYMMLGGAVAVPISLFWMGWTSNPSISIWSPLIVPVFFGYGITTIFIVAYLYLIGSYDTYSAFALGFPVFTQYVMAGGVTVAGGPIYEALSVQYTLTILGSISAVMALVPYLLYFFGPITSKKSKYALNVDTE
ncbi:C6 transcription factor [Aspergillus eucalypticola CBS 122712]|uniref:C6 transcription factor n=1 Tax=Aspergillus eucalypticola (strain CBS 122712 / IBT 29274) TaxID=1448314 RepID=A0A317W104_ASPEC|nr:C6 transcription factor [Aspergillus eucalypticola CBS 122712]PWY78942.1 C6 transcription factor [Aspergillus eucalypticola CBS 122712]